MGMRVRDREGGRPQTINQNGIFVRKPHGSLLRYPARLGLAAPRSHCLANKNSTARYGAHSLGQGGLEVPQVVEVLAISLGCPQK